MNRQQQGIAALQITSQLQTINYDGKTYKYDRQPVSDEGALHLRYRAARKVNAEDLSKPVINLRISLDEGLDLYDLKVQVFDGNINELFAADYSGVYAEDFGNFKTL